MSSERRKDVRWRNDTRKTSSIDKGRKSRNTMEEVMQEGKEKRK